jgi:hypothetical protein
MYNSLVQEYIIKGTKTLHKHLGLATGFFLNIIAFGLSEFF